MLIRIVNEHPVIGLLERHHLGHRVLISGKQHSAHHAAGIIEQRIVICGKLRFLTERIVIKALSGIDEQKLLLCQIVLLQGLLKDCRVVYGQILKHDAQPPDRQIPSEPSCKEQELSNVKCQKIHAVKAFSVYGNPFPVHGLLEQVLHQLRFPLLCGADGLITVIPLPQPLSFRQADRNLIGRLSRDGA